MMPPLLDFLRSRITEDEIAAMETPRAPYRVKTRDSATSDAITAHAQRWQPNRVVNECAAKREILRIHGPRRDESGQMWCAACITDGHSYGSIWPCPTVCALASAYSEHPDYDPSWKRSPSPATS